MKKTILLSGLAVLAAVAWLSWRLHFNRESQAAPAQTAAPHSTNSSAIATAQIQTNPPSTMTGEAEFAELRRLEWSSLTNLAAVRERAALVEKMRVRRFSELSRGEEPVAAAIKIALEPHGPRPDGIRELAKHWNDPRAEQTLEQISNRGPRNRGELGATYEGEAYACLLELRARRRLAEITAGKSSEAERMSAIVEYLDSQPDLAAPWISGQEKYVLTLMLLGEIEVSNDPAAVRVVFRSGQIKPAFAQKHFQEMFEYAETLKPEEALNNPGLIEALDRSRSRAVIPIFEKWVPYATEPRDKDYFARRIEALRKEP